VSRTIILMTAALFTVAIAVGAATAGAMPDDGHPALLPTVAPTSAFPLYDADELARNGYPDHQHGYFWPGWLPPLDEHGEPYGFGSFCTGLHSRDRVGFTAKPGLVSFAPFSLEFNAEAEPCLVAPFLGFCEMALIDAQALLGLAPVGELQMNTPDSMDMYTAMTGNGPWRMFSYRSGTAVMQPVGILARRTLIAHAARDVVTLWLLDVNGGERLPAWFREGLSAWVAEMGVHLCNYMASYRLDGDVLWTPDRIETVLSSPAASDPEADRRDYRMARYGAFLMVWHLVENHGGLEPLREVLASVSQGTDPDAAFREAYDLGLAELTTLLDPVTAGEPIGTESQPRNPARPPRNGG